MVAWEDYKQRLRQMNPELNSDVDEIEALSQIVGAIIEQRHELSLTQRELADLCGLTHSSVARIEAGRTTPNLTTLLKILDKLGLSLKVEKALAESQ